MPWAAIIGAIVAAGATYYNNQQADDRAQDANKPGPTVANPYYEPLMARMFAVLDQYLAKNELTQYIPKDRMPFELLPPDQQQAIYDQIGTANANGEATPPAGLMPPPPLYVPTQEVEPGGGGKPPPKGMTGAGGTYGSTGDGFNHYGQPIQDKEGGAMMPTSLSGKDSPAAQMAEGGGAYAADTGSAAGGGAAATDAGGGTSITTTGSDGSTTNAAIGAVGTAAGAYLQNQNHGSSGGIKTVTNPYYEPFMARMLAVLDGYLIEHGIAAFIPKDRMPFELQTPEQQQNIYNNIATANANGDPTPPAGLMPPPPLYVPTQEIEPGGGGKPPPKGMDSAATGGSHGSPHDNTNNYGQPIQDKAQAQPLTPTPLNSQARGSVVYGPQGQGAIESPRNPEMSAQGYSDADLAAQIAARRMGLENQPAFETPVSTQEQRKQMSQEELQSLYRYVYGPS